jgi:hypothetical protein
MTGSAPNRLASEGIAGRSVGIAVGIGREPVAELRPPSTNPSSELADAFGSGARR